MTPRRIAKLLWAVPCSLVGLLLAGPILLLGGRLAPFAGTLEITYRPNPARCGRFACWLPFRAITFGHVILAVTREELDYMRGHERVHVEQYERWGLLFFPAYGASSLWQLLRGRRAYWDNRFEVEARRRAGEGRLGRFESDRQEIVMAESYTPPRVWTWDAASGGQFASINRPIAGATHDKPLPVGKHPLQLYSLATPNGAKVAILLEELLERGIKGAEYDAWLIRINQGDQFGSGFVEVNPNSKIPALVDRSVEPSIRVFESGSILLYLAEKFGAFVPTDPAGRAECLNWLFWQMGSAPFVGGGFGHFYAYAPEKYEYPINRYAMETKRQLDVLDRRLAEQPYVAGKDYTIADMAIWPWYGVLVRGGLYDAAEFLDGPSYKNVLRWADEIAQRPGVQRGRMVNRTWGEPSEQLHERHDAGDFETRTQDKLDAAGS